MPAGVHRPLWSVMIPTYNCAALLRETLKSVLAQDPGREQMQIEVIDDASTKDDPEAVVRELGQGRVAFHRHSKNIGATANFNTCLSRSRGTLVQILHGDDLVLPGFYDRMRGVAGPKPARPARPFAGSYSSTTLALDRAAQGDAAHLGHLPAARLRTIASENWAQFAAVVLEAIARRGCRRVPPIPVSCRRLGPLEAGHSSINQSRTSRRSWPLTGCSRGMIRQGSSRPAQTSPTSRRAIDLSAHYLPHPESASWIQDARHNLANWAKHCAVQMSVIGDYEAFRNQLREACLLEPAFYWSRKHFGLRYRFMKQSLKQRLIERKGRPSTRRLLEPETGSAST